jgi:hypothetical protein
MKIFTRAAAAIALAWSLAFAGMAAAQTVPAQTATQPNGAPAYVAPFMLWNPNNGSPCWTGNTSCPGLGGGPISIAAGQAVDCAIATIGCEADAAWASGNGTLVALLKATIAAINSTGSMQGVTATGASVTENPLLAGCTVATSSPTSQANGTKQAAVCGETGKLIVLNGAIKENTLQGAGVSTASTSAISLTGMGAQGAGVKIYIKSIQCGRTDTGTTALTVTLNDGASTTVVIPNSGGGGGNNATFDPPLIVAANTASTFTSDTSVSSLKCAEQGWKGA